MPSDALFVVWPCRPSRLHRPPWRDHMHQARRLPPPLDQPTPNPMKDTTMTQDSPTVKVGQIWEDNDPRMEGRQVRVTEIGNTHATVVPHQERPPVSSTKPGRRTRIRLDRFRPISTGYRYVGESA